MPLMQGFGRNKPSWVGDRMVGGGEGGNENNGNIEKMRKVKQEGT